jgi:two-component system, OmpR family, response regulator
MHLLLVEDDAMLGEAVCDGARQGGWTIDHVCDAPAARLALIDHAYAAVLLDIGLPGESGLSVLRAMRGRYDPTPVLMLTARGQLSERIHGLDAGADDYIVKPFGFAELMARIRAVLRRSRRLDGHTLRHGALAIDTRERRVTMRGAEIGLTPTEFDILECLATDPGRVVSRREILERVWNTHWYGPTRVLDVHIAALRRKLGDSSAICTVYARGFRLGDLT